MDTIRLRPECISCIVNKQIEKYPASVSMKDKIEYMKRVLKIIADAPINMSAPEIVNIICGVQREMFSIETDYTEIKKHFNDLMLKTETFMRNEIHKSGNPLKRAVQFAMTGNYIDFSAIENVDEKELKRLLEESDKNPVDDSELMSMHRDILQSKRITYLTDNCGEIVADKLLISVIKDMNPSAQLTAVVRGGNVVNDATMEDAKQVGLTDIITVIGNGSNIAGTSHDKISHDARVAIDYADMIISKGQGNYETLQKCGKNIYYIFMCKCKMFTEKFRVPLYQGILINDRTPVQNLE